MLCHLMSGGNTCNWSYNFSLHFHALSENVFIELLLCAMDMLELREYNMEQNRNRLWPPG